MKVSLFNPTIALVAHDGCGVTSDEIRPIVDALQVQVERDYRPAFGNGAALRVLELKDVNPAGKAGWWIIGLFKDADQPGALGYHDEVSSGVPFAKIFPLLDAQDGADVSSTISHELLEMLADPLLNRSVQGPDGKFWAYEICDAVERDEYVIDGVKVSNFVTPQYFEPPKNIKGVAFDFLGLCKKPYEIRPGGYGQYNQGSGWHQVVHKDVAPRAYRRSDMSRSATRGRR